MSKIKEKAIMIFLVIILLYSRFVNLGWGLPYPMHPDERNMVMAIQGLSCSVPYSVFNIPNIINIFKNCFNPHFFAYGQFSLYAGYLIILLLKFFDGDLGTPIGFSEAAFSLRLISALASVINVMVLVEILKIVFNKTDQMNKDRSAQAKTKFSSFSFFYILILIFVPYAIQFAHFGTTESLLMLFYSLIVYGSLKYWNKLIPGRQYVMMTSFFVGLAVATKISSLVFVGIPVLVILFSGERPKRIIINCCIFIFFVAVISLLFSPQSLISWPEFINSMKYESAVGTGSMPVFYTRQFLGSLPIVFQMEKIFPYVLGWPIFIFFLFGFALLSWKKKSNNLLRLAFLVYFIPNAGLFAKWTRFMAPVFPVATLISVIFINKLISNIKNQKTKFQIKNKKVFNVVFNIFIFQIFVLILIPGIAYLSIYQNQDVRFKASEWIYKNIPNGTTILSETANVVDIPLPGKQSQGKDLKIISFDFYELDNSLMLQQELKDYLKESGYIFVPSRRIFMNHLKKNYPVLNEYYQNLFSGQARFFLVKEFNAYPRICLPLIKSCFIYPDEQAEETWSVFDHPTIRIYKKITKG